MPAHRNPAPWPNCLACGKPVNKRSCRYCSRKCWLEHGWAKFGDIPCKHCGQPFKQKKPSNVFCSRLCADDFERASRIEYKCPVCGDSFRNKPCATRRFCSKTCKDAWMPSQRPVMTCEWCKIQFTSSRGHKIKRVYCSKKCQMAHHHDRASKIVCEHCGKEFVNPGNPSPRFCSRSCFWQHRGPTSIEKAVAAILTGLHADFAREFPLSGYEFDFIVPSVRLLIECDGDYWHSFKEAKNRDRIKTNRALKLGYRVLRLSETLIESDPAQVRRLIVKELKRSGQLPLPARYTLT